MSETKIAGALPAKQERSQESARRIVDAVESLLKRKSFDQLTMVEIAAEAGLTPGAIYRRFENKEALLPPIFDLHRAILGDWLQRVNADDVIEATVSFEEAVEFVIRETHACFKAHAHIFRTVHLYGRVHPRGRITGGASINNPSFSPLDGIVKHYSADLGGFRKQDVQMMGHVLLSAVTERTLYPDNMPAAGLRVSDRVFVSNLAKMITAWLL